MPRKLHFTTFVAPNKENETHYFFTNVSAYLNRFSLTTAYSIDFPNYRINNGLAIIKKEPNANIDIEKAKTITYLLDSEPEKGYLRAYFVRSVEDQSGNLIFKVELDKWATYISKAIFGRMHITRSNLYGNNAGFYDEALAGGFLEVLEDSRLSGTFTPSQVSIVFLLNYNVSQGVFNNDKIGRCEMFAVTLQDCIDACTLVGLNKNALTAVEMALDIVGGISGAQSNTGNNEAEVIKAWIVPTSWLEYGDVVLTKLTGKSLFSSANDGLALNNVRQVVPSFKTGSYNMANFQRFVDNYPNHIVYFGPKYNGFKVPRRLPAYSTKELRIYYRVTIGQDDVQVVLYTGEEEHDISQNFEVRLTTANNVANPLQAMARDLSFGLNFTQSLFSGYKNGGAVGAAVSGAKSLLSNIKDAGISKVNGSGDGFASWNEGAERSAAHTLKKPYFYMYYSTMADEAARAVINGAKYDVFIDDLSDLKTTYTNMRFVASSTKETRAFVQIDEAYVYGVPSEALEYIKAELARGVYYAFIE